jgi:uncharacterized protein (TIGR02145 family)
MRTTLFLLSFTISFYFSAQITDIDGNSYDTVRIGTQTWMSENLNVSRFRNGDFIPEAKTEEEWIKAGENKQPAWCYYDNDTTNGVKYGKLYNWYAVIDLRGLAASGWHIPSDSEWVILTDHIGDDEIKEKKLKSTTGWANYEGQIGNGNNKSEFSALPGGYRDQNGAFSSMSYGGNWWCLTENNTLEAWDRYFNSIIHDADRFSTNKGNALSVRCVKD